MAYLQRGALIEYGSDFMGPIPNVVIFQFNPETLTREIQIPERPTGAGSRESHQAGEIPIEKINLVAKFSAADELGDNDQMVRAFGVGTRLSALEKMVHPKGIFSGMITAAVDRIGDAIRRRQEEGASLPVPRENYPRILFIWGVTRILPVVIDSMSIEEKKYDNLLNPVEAEVTIGMTVLTRNFCSDDLVARGAWECTNLAKEMMAAANYVNTGTQIVDIFSF